MTRGEEAHYLIPATFNTIAFYIAFGAIAVFLSAVFGRRSERDLRTATVCAVLASMLMLVGVYLARSQEPERIWLQQIVLGIVFGMVAGACVTSTVLWLLYRLRH